MAESLYTFDLFSLSMPVIRLGIQLYTSTSGAFVISFAQEIHFYFSLFLLFDPLTQNVTLKSGTVGLGLRPHSHRHTVHCAKRTCSI